MLARGRVLLAKEMKLPGNGDAGAGTVARTRPAQVLLFDHTAELGDGEIARTELVRQFDRSRVDPVLLLGSHGPLEELLEGRCRCI